MENLRYINIFIIYFLFYIIKELDQFHLNEYEHFLRPFTKFSGLKRQTGLLLYDLVLFFFILDIKKLQSSMFHI
jgi:hypothetical protein